MDIKIKKYEIIFVKSRAYININIEKRKSFIITEFFSKVPCLSFSDSVFTIPSQIYFQLRYLQAGAILMPNYPSHRICISGASISWIFSFIILLFFCYFFTSLNYQKIP
jgi:hypothetical protein